MLAWSLVLASTLGLASLFQALVASALGGPVTSTSVPGQVPPGAQADGPSCVWLFGSYNAWLFSGGGRGPCGLGPDVTTTPVTAALADGDDVRARFLAQQPGATCQMVAGQPLYAGQDTWVAHMHRQCANAVP